MLQKLRLPPQVTKTSSNGKMMCKETKVTTPRHQNLNQMEGEYLSGGGNPNLNTLLRVVVNTEN